MFGFEHNDIDMNDTVPLYALKVFLRKNMPILRPKIQKGVVEGMEVCLRPQIPSCDGEFALAIMNPWNSRSPSSNHYSTDFN